ncbi:MAG: hypothetical protein BWK80_13010 [Desulfobacteraceae bacterium IS3]|nr:MAG: hypothetical protein BWK80_13010 [Desulfobacteraceae bacterium IS3]
MTTEQKDVAALAKDGNKVIRNHMLVSMGVGLIPIPIADMVGITAVQLNMLRKLAKIHEVPFTQHKVKSILTALVGGGGSLTVAEGFASLIKFVPVVGTTVGAVSMPITAGAITYAVGKVFLQHFASGGTFLTFDPEKVREYYAEMFKEGKTAAADMTS